MDLAGRTEKFISQAGINGQPRVYFEVILNEACEIRVALIFAEVTGGACAGENVAHRTAVLRCAFSQEKVGETQEEEEAIFDKGHIHVELRAFGLTTNSKMVPSVGP